MKCFFSDLQKSHSIHVWFRGINSDPRSLQLYFDNVAEVANFKTLKRGIIYEMKAYYPTIDGVGYLKDGCNEWWLVFIQVSLSRYVDHKKFMQFVSQRCRCTLKLVKVYILSNIIQNSCWLPKRSLKVLWSHNQIILLLLYSLAGECRKSYSSNVLSNHCPWHPGKSPKILAASVLPSICKLKNLQLCSTSHITLSYEVYKCRASHISLVPFT